MKLLLLPLFLAIISGVSCSGKNQVIRKLLFWNGISLRILFLMSSVAAVIMSRFLKEVVI